MNREHVQDKRERKTDEREVMGIPKKRERGELFWDFVRTLKTCEQKNHSSF